MADKISNEQLVEFKRRALRTRDDLGMSHDQMNVNVIIAMCSEITVARQQIAGMEAVELSPDQAWQDLLDKDDRTSPEDYPDMALITKSELTDYMHACQQIAGMGWLGIAEAPSARRFLTDFLVSNYYNPNAERPADIIEAAIAFAIRRTVPTPEVGARSYEVRGPYHSPGDIWPHLRVQTGDGENIAYVPWRAAPGDDDEAALAVAARIITALTLPAPPTTDAPASEGKS